MKKVMVTGGAGFIGGYVVEELLRRDYEPMVFDHHGRSPFGVIEKPMTVFLGDCRDATAVTEAMGHVDGWIHLAAVLGTQETMRNPRPAVESNITGGLNMLEAAVQYGVPGVYIGVGNYWMQNPYSISKTTVERFVDMYNHYRGSKVNVVRAMNAYGPRQVPAHPYGSARVRKITPSFICRALSGDPIEIYGDGQQVSDMIYVADVATALVNALECAEDGMVFGHAIECGPVDSNTVFDVALLIRKLCDSRSEIKFLPMRPGEIPDSKVSANTKTLKAIGINPEEDLTSLKDGMAKTVEYFQQYYSQEL